MNKKIVAVLCAFFTLFGLCSCNNKEPDNYYVYAHIVDEKEDTFAENKLEGNRTLSLNCSIEKTEKGQYAYEYEITFTAKENKKETMNELYVIPFEENLAYYNIVTENDCQFYVGEFCLEYDLKDEHIKEFKDRENANKFLIPTFEFSLPKHAKNIEAKFIYKTYYDELHIPAVAQAVYRTIA